jgi:hypothetical protein
MKEIISKKMVVRVALAIGASLTVVATSALPAFADPGPVVPNGVPSLYCDKCDDNNSGPDAGGSDPGGRQDPGWGVSNHIGEGRAGQEGGGRYHPPPRSHR